MIKSIYARELSREEQGRRDFLNELVHMVRNNQSKDDSALFDQFIRRSDGRSLYCLKVFELAEVVQLEMDKISVKIRLFNRPIRLNCFSSSALLETAAKICTRLVINDSHESVLEQSFQYFLPKNRIKSIIFQDISFISANSLRKLLKASSSLELFESNYTLSKFLTGTIKKGVFYFELIRWEFKEFMRTKKFFCRDLTIRRTDPTVVHLFETIDILRLYKGEPHHDVEIFSLIMENTQMDHKLKLDQIYVDVIRIFPNVKYFNVKLGINVLLEKIFDLPVLCIQAQLDVKKFNFNCKFVMIFHTLVKGQLFNYTFINEVARKITPKYHCRFENDQFIVSFQNEPKDVTRGYKIFTYFIYFSYSDNSPRDIV